MQKRTNSNSAEEFQDCRMDCDNEEMASVGNNKTQTDMEKLVSGLNASLLELREETAQTNLNMQQLCEKVNA